MHDHDESTGITEPLPAVHLLDGETWHNVRADFAALTGKRCEFAGFAEPGKSVLLWCNQHLTEASYDHGHLILHPLEQDELRLLRPPSLQMRSLSGKTWWGDGTRSYAWEHGKILLREPGRSLFIDSQDRVWMALNLRTLQCVRKTDFPEVAADLESFSRVVETPQHELYLLRGSGVSRINLENNTLSLGEIHNWQGPRNFFLAPFCDSTKGLWFDDTKGRVTRVQLP